MLAEFFLYDFSARYKSTDKFDWEESVDAVPGHIYNLQFVVDGNDYQRGIYSSLGVEQCRYSVVFEGIWRVEPYPAVRVYAYTPRNAFNPSTSSYSDRITRALEAQAYRSEALDLKNMHSRLLQVQVKTAFTRLVCDSNLTNETYPLYGCLREFGGSGVSLELPQVCPNSGPEATHFVSVNLCLKATMVMRNIDDQCTPTQASLDSSMRAFEAQRSNRMREELCFQASEMPAAHIMALDQLIQYQCAHLEKQLVALRVKRELLHQGKTVFVSLNELVSEECLEAAEDLLGSVTTTTNGSVDTTMEQPFTLSRSRTVGDEISHIIDSMNAQTPHDDGFNEFMRSVQFMTDDVDMSVCTQAPRRCVTLPEGRPSDQVAGDIQLMLHLQGSCKPCAFYYNKKKGCRNGNSCGFCHHEDHSLSTLKQWKKQQRLASQSGSLSCEKLGEILNPNLAPQ
ncbi:hypothetical protein BaOVIS_001510 [Babesia ovis]|uniref:C3H1-type domain-containing protein n=1 Tax=Babesia ovis TaxID=5869 RepID=A0A9W5T7Z0_BABOV|nr:hypothetical protein BaOVIS_001510 [Babesia ovis]